MHIYVVVRLLAPRKVAAPVAEARLA